MNMTHHHHQYGNVTVEYVICVVACLVFIVTAAGQDDIVTMFRHAYQLFFGGFSSAILNMDAIP